MQPITPCLWFDDQALEAAEFYVSIFPESRVLGANSPQSEPKPLTVEFELNGQPFIGLNGGPVYEFNPAISLTVYCADQSEVDYYWERLTDGGKEVQCGWVTDRYGVSWQVVPSVLKELLSGPDAEASARTMQAMLKMIKLDIAELQRAHDGA